MNEFIKKGKTDPNQYIYQNDTFDSGSANLAFKGSAIVDSDPVGTFNTYYKSVNTQQSLNLSTSAPTQSISDIMNNGFYITSASYSIATTAALPSRFDIKIGKNFKQQQILGYKNSSKSLPIQMDSVLYSTTSQFGGPKIGYDPNTGILTIEAGFNISTGISANQFIDMAGASFNTAYFTVSGSKSIGALLMGNLRQITISAAQTLESNTSYFVDAASQISLTLPATSKIGDVIEILGKAGGWKLYSNASAAAQQVNIGGTSSPISSNSSILLRLSASVYDTIRLVCITANSIWNAEYVVGTSAPYITATGGSITTVGDYKIHSFTSSGTFQITQGSGTVESLVVAGGGGGGGNSSGGGGGGGAGGVLYTTPGALFSPGSYNVVVGLGGAADTNGNNSSFDTLVATGGGSGATYSAAGGNGGSGGGGAAQSGATTAGGTGVSGQGFGGGNGAGTWYGGGGGGANGAGLTNGVNPSHGGPGISNSITGSAIYYGGGGGGGAAGGTCGTGGVGGGGNGTTGGTGGSGTANTGGGGGGSSSPGGPGGSGIVILKYKFQ